MSKYFKDMDYELLDRKTAYKGKRIVVEELHYYNPRTKETLYREHVLADDAVIVMAITDDNELIMIQEPRTPVGRTVLTFAAGRIEKGEKPEDAAVRELEEETGYLAKTIKHMRTVCPTVGYSNERVAVFLAKDLVKTHRHLDEAEDIKVIKIPLEEAKQMLDNKEFETAIETVALLHYFTYECEG